MSRRPKVRARWRVAIAPLLLSLVCAGCSRPIAARSDGSNQDQADPHRVPFREGALNSANDPGSYDSATFRDGARITGAALPFRDGQNLPAGTLLAIRLNKPISAASLTTDLPFEGTIDEPVSVEGNALVSGGVSVTGHVESASLSRARSTVGYVRLVLDSIEVDGIDTPIRTSSVFARGKVGPTQVGRTQSPGTVIRLEKDRVLTFRLADPLYLASRRESVSH